MTKAEFPSFYHFLSPAVFFFIKDDHYIILKVKKLNLITQEIRAQQLRYTSTFYLSFKRVIKCKDLGVFVCIS